MNLRTVIGSFGLLQRRSRELGQPGLTVYTAAGASAAAEVGKFAGERAHKNECAERDMEAELRAILADGKVDEAELRRLNLFPGSLNRCAERSHDIGEAMKL